jgi:hypothetical protein
MYYASGYLVFDFMNEPIRWFSTYEEAKYFTSNRHECKIKKQTIDFNKEEPCLF